MDDAVAGLAAPGAKVPMHLIDECTVRLMTLVRPPDGPSQALDVFWCASAALSDVDGAAGRAFAVWVARAGAEAIDRADAAHGTQLVTHAMVLAVTMMADESTAARAMGLAASALAFAERACASRPLWLEAAARHGDAAFHLRLPAFLARGVVGWASGDCERHATLACGLLPALAAAVSSRTRLADEAPAAEAAAAVAVTRGKDLAVLASRPEAVSALLLLLGSAGSGRPTADPGPGGAHWESPARMIVRAFGRHASALAPAEACEWWRLACRPVATMAAQLHPGASGGDVGGLSALLATLPAAAAGVVGLCGAAAEATESQVAAGDALSSVACAAAVLASSAAQAGAGPAAASLSWTAVEAVLLAGPSHFGAVVAAELSAAALLRPECRGASTVAVSCLAGPARGTDPVSAWERAAAASRDTAAGAPGLRPVAKAVAASRCWLAEHAVLALRALGESTVAAGPAQHPV